MTTEIDTRRFLGQRVAAMAEHRSQRSPFEGLPPALFEAFLTREHLIRVRPAWPGGPLETDLVDQASEKEETTGVAEATGVAKTTGAKEVADATGAKEAADATGAKEAARRGTVPA